MKPNASDVVAAKLMLDRVEAEAEATPGLCVGARR
jgi:hypothetical protein